MNIPQHLRTSRTEIKEAKFELKEFKKNVHNFNEQRQSFIGKIIKQLDDIKMDIKIRLWSRREL